MATWALKSKLKNKESSEEISSYIVIVHTTSSWPRQDPRKAFFASTCRANTDPPVTKIRLWASFGEYRSGLIDEGTFKFFFDDFKPKKPRKSSPSVLDF